MPANCEMEPSIYIDDARGPLLQVSVGGLPSAEQVPCQGEVGEREPGAGGRALVFGVTGDRHRTREENLGVN